jgi:hypothetical protein
MTIPTEATLPACTLCKKPCATGVFDHAVHRWIPSCRDHSNVEPLPKHWDAPPGAPAGAKAPAAPAPLERWEYAHHDLPAVSGVSGTGVPGHVFVGRQDPRFAQWLNALGAKGWHLLEVLEADGVALFERRVRGAR